MIEVRDLNLLKGGKPILSNINLFVKTGEILSLIGPTGAGKTSLIRIMDLLDTPTSGEVLYDGQTLETESSRLKARRCMSMVFQRPALFNSKVFDNVAYGLRVRGIRGQELKSSVSQALLAVGLEEYSFRRASTLSGGEIQRVALARSLVLCPKVLFLDEPTSNLDPHSATLMEDLFLRENKKGVTVIIATHDIGQSMRLSNRIGVMMDGKLVQTDIPSKVWNEPASNQIKAFLQAARLPDHLDQ